MNRDLVMGVALAVLAAGAVLAEGPKSGPKVGDMIPGPFNPYNVTGDDAGQKRCQVWRNGANPVVVIFAREVTDPLTSLVKRIDEATAKNADVKMGSFVVFCNDDEKLEKALKSLNEKEKLKRTVLTIDNPAGPEGYEIAKDADVTVVLYNKFVVKANHSFKKGELDAKAIDRIIADVAKIIPER